MEEAKKYRLYVGKYQPLDDEIEYAYFGSHHKYMLVFSERLPKGKFEELPECLLKQLTQDEKKWLYESKVEINAKYLNENKEQSIEILENFINCLERELKKLKSEERN